MAEALAEAGFQCVVGRVGDAGDQAGGSEFAGAGIVCERASGIKAALISVIFTEWNCRWTGRERRPLGLPSMKRGSFDPFRSDVADFEQKIVRQRTLDIEVPILRVRQGQIWSESEIG